MFVLIWHIVFRSCELILKHLPWGAIIVEVVDCIRAYQGFLSIVRCHWVLCPPPSVNNSINDNNSGQLPRFKLKEVMFSPN